MESVEVAGLTGAHVALFFDVKVSLAQWIDLGLQLVDILGLSLLGKAGEEC